MGDGGDLLGLAFAAVEGAAEFVGRLAAESVAGFPEIDRVPLVGDVAEHAVEFAVTDAVEDLTGELKVVTLLINAPAPVAVDEDAVLDIGDEAFSGDGIVLPGLQGNVGG